jgi:predicted secreted protein
VENGAEKVSYDDLSEIFVRSKATISECVNATEGEWREIQQKVADEQKLEEEARRQLIEEKKQKLREIEQNNQTINQTSEQTPNTSSGEDNTARLYS